ncbi:MAG: hypothetical protein AAF750_16260 [Planctomycetota bacterium]
MKLPRREHLYPIPTRLFRGIAIGAGLLVGAMTAYANPTDTAPILDVSQPAISKAESIKVQSRTRRSNNWKTYEATTYDQALAALGVSATSPPKLSKYGGRLDIKHRATGFFRVEKIDGRWWMIDPLGHPLIRKGITSAYRDGFGALPEARKAELGYQSAARWAKESTELARDLGFNAWGRWSNIGPLRKAPQPLPYVTSLKVMVRFGGELSLTTRNYGNMGFEHSLIPSFHPDFPAFARKYVREELAKTKDDPWLVGHYLDNELPTTRTALERALKLDPKHPVHKYTRAAAWKFLRAKYGRNAKPSMVTHEDNKDFLGVIFERYYRIASEAVREVDPNHMILGSRLHGSGHKWGALLAACGKHCDIVSINLYGYWEPSDEQMERWERFAQSPFIISEFYVRGVDSGLPDDKGAGWVVKTQRDRALWYQNFTLQLLRSRGSVGWDYFKFRDDIDQNKGLLRHDWRPYPAFTAPIRDAHAKVYPLIDAMDKN